MLNDKARENASSALLAYNAMETTKRRHFDYLNLLEAKKKKFNLAATEQDEKLLESLLKDHDHAVQSFKQLSQQLQSTDPAAHQALFDYVAVLNETLNQIAQNSAH